jgi:hypothetical protein
VGESDVDLHGAVRADQLHAELLVNMKLGIWNSECGMRDTHSTFQIPHS